MVFSYDLTSKTFSSRKKKSDYPNPLYHPLKQVRRVNFYNFHSMSMKFCMVVTFGGGYNLKRNTKVSVPCLTHPITNFGPLQPLQTTFPPPFRRGPQCFSDLSHLPPFSSHLISSHPGRTARATNTGTAYTFFTMANVKQSKDLINVLKEANQVRS